MLPDTDKKSEKPLIIKMAGYLEKKGRMVSVKVENMSHEFNTFYQIYKFPERN